MQTRQFTIRKLCRYLVSLRTYDIFGPNLLMFYYEKSQKLIPYKNNLCAKI